ncbi:MAG: 4-(cytidine 5'-diphospho)-2-C-methyl-D-erythritol kinase [Gemmataceae bacterium]|nr:4-(cytidine 5'-diphospho)-2-C-methyl-D-erythritol kinase [Gemmataceae bacterium]
MGKTDCRSVCLLAPAKVNLFLEIQGKRPDGYHELETFMVAVDLFDRLIFEFAEDGTIRLECDEPGLTTGPDNLVWKAADQLRQKTGTNQGARIRLEKRVPMQSGLAGGSSDAAATLKGLNRLWRLGLSQAELAAIGAEIGSDVPFFFAAGSAWCTGRGEQVESWTLRRPVHLVLVCPGQGLSTAEVYSRVRVPAERIRSERMRQALGTGDVEALGRCLHNRLQEPAESLLPVIREICERLRQAGTAGCLMTGSGSAVFALCRDRHEAIRVARSIRAEVADSSTPIGESSRPPASAAGSRVQVHVVRSCP